MTSLGVNLLAVTIDLNLGVILFGVGALGLLLAILIGINSIVGKSAAALGLCLLVGGYLMKGGGVSPPLPFPIPGPDEPAPTPGPGPFTPPAPSSFADGVKLAFSQDGGTIDDATYLSALFLQMSATLEWDGKQEKPRIVSGPNLGQGFARLQQYRMLQNPTNLAERFPRFETFIDLELKRLGLTEGQWDESKRTNAVLLFRAVGDALRTT